MIRVTLKGLLARKLRLALTAIAIVLGVAMVSGTFVLTDTINAGIKALVGVAYANADAVVTGKVTFGSTDVLDTPSFPASTLTKIEQLPDVSSSAGEVRADTEIVGRDGSVVSRAGEGGEGFGIDRAYEPFTAVRIVRGRWPVGPTQVAIDAQTARSQHDAVGDRVGIIVQGGRERSYTISGIVDFGSTSSLAGITISVFALPVARQLFGDEGKLDQVDVAAKPGVSTSALLAQIQAVLPPHTQALTSAQQAQAEVNDDSSAIDTFRDLLLVFGAIALFVGAFVIANTLSITVAQRMRELATLRTLGASKQQVVFAVLLEGLVLGVVASTIGLFVGLGLGKGLEELFKAEGVSLPLTGLIFATRTVIVALAVGIVVTLAASLRPALRATRVPPIAAVREGAVLPRSRLARLGPAVALAVCAGAIGLLCVGGFVSSLPTGTRLLLLGVGVLAMLLGVAMVAPSIARPLAGALGWPASRLAGGAGTLARSNAMRNPGRTASTAATLMIGLALVTAFAVLGQGLEQGIIGSVESEFLGNYVVSSQDGGFDPTSIAPAQALRRSGIATVVADERSGQGLVLGETLGIAGLDPSLAKLLTLKWKVGDNNDLATLGTDGAIVSAGFASANNLTVGSPVQLETPTGRTVRLHVHAIYKPPEAGNPLGTVSISARTFDAIYPNPQDIFTLVSTPGGVTAANTAALSRVLAPFPDAQLQTEQAFIDSQESAIDSELHLIYILLALSIVVSLFGIVNTLVLTVFERTRELGMLRAIGMSRRQARRMIRYESVVTALIGAALGLPVGVGLAALFDRVLSGVPFAVPWGSLVVFVIAAIVVGLFAAIFPARRASRLNILQALHYE